MNDYIPVSERSCCRDNCDRKWINMFSQLCGHHQDELIAMVESIKDKNED